MICKGKRGLFKALAESDPQLEEFVRSQGSESGPFGFAQGRLWGTRRYHEVQWASTNGTISSLW
jgi:hypothetical protein